MTPLICYHDHCPDGYGAAWWLGKALGEHDELPCNYGDTPDIEPGREVYFVDFCFPAREMTQIAAQCKSLLVLDHHKSAVDYIADAAGIQFYDDLSGWMEFAELGSGSMREAVIDQKNSGIGLVSKFVKRRWGWDSPMFFLHVEDRDLWRFQYNETPAVFAAVTSRPYADEAWDEMAAMFIWDLASEGEAIERYRQQLVRQCLDRAYQRTFTVFGDLGERGSLEKEQWEGIWVANAPYAICSDVAGELAKRDPERFAATFFIDDDGPKWSLRSTDVGMDVSEVAALMQPGIGGGHVHAAGFRGAW